MIGRNTIKWAIMIEWLKRRGSARSSSRRQSTLEEPTSGRPLDFTRGVVITQGLLGEILDAAPRDADGNPRLLNADFSDATFEDGA